MNPNKYQLRQADFGTQLLTGADDDPLTYGINLASDDDDTFFELDRGITVGMDEDVDVEALIGGDEPMGTCQASIQNMKDVELTALSLPHLTWFAHAFCAVHHLKPDETLNLKIKSTEEAIFLDHRNVQPKFIQWMENADVEYKYYNDIWLAEQETRRTNWQDCQDPNNPIHITFKSPKDDLWKHDQVFYQSTIIKYLSQKNYKDEVSIHHDLCNGINTLNGFFNHNWNENLAAKDFGAWLFQEVYSDDSEEPKPTLDWLIDEWKALNACYFQVTSGPQFPQDFKDFIAKGIFFF